MSFMHLAAFTEDVHSINPKLKLSTSSLQRLVQYLTQNAAKPTVLTEQRALQMCKKRNSLEKYKPAIARLCGVWGKSTQYPNGKKTVHPYPSFNHGSTPKSVTLNRLVFRGDDRPPKSIFATGFKKRPKHANSKPLYENYKTIGVQPVDANKSEDVTYYLEKKIMHGMSKSGDVDSDTTVCITSDMFVSALFPLPTKESRLDFSYLYLCFARKGYDTNGRQVLDALRGAQQLARLEATENWSYDPLRVKHAIKMGVAPGQLGKELHEKRTLEIFRFVYGKELATDGIPTGDIFGAIKIERTWNSVVYKNRLDKVTKKAVPYAQKADAFAGGTFRITEMHQNPNLDLTKLDGATALAAMRFAAGIQQDMKQGKIFKIPKPSDGYVKSDPEHKKFLAAT
ncbi:MAG: hypothetical protein AAGA47_13325 [Pseudomonadota bacterium]